MARMQAGVCQLVLVLWDFENVLPPAMIDDNRVHCSYHIGDSLAKSGHKFAAEILRRQNSLPTTETAVLDGVLVVAEWAKRLYMKRPDRRELFQRSHVALSRVQYLQLGDCPGKRWKKEADHKIQQAMGSFAAKCRALDTAGEIVLISSDKDFDSAVHEARQQGIDVIIIHNKEVDPYFLEKGTTHIEWHEFLSTYIQPHLKYQLESGKLEQYGPPAGRGRASRRVAGTSSQYRMTAAAAAPSAGAMHVASPMASAAAGAMHMPVTPEKHAHGAYPRYYELDGPHKARARSDISPPRWPGSYQLAAAAAEEEEELILKTEAGVEEGLCHLGAGEGEEHTKEDDYADEVTEWETEAGSDDVEDDADSTSGEAEPSEWEEVSEEGQSLRQECRVQ